jgi:hypothetical protein
VKENLNINQLAVLHLKICLLTLNKGTYFPNNIYIPLRTL